ncbi:Rieske (2Fe-2S) protein [Mucilaginibacter calamicampi]|uniref:Rieske (2Fe-2S) protein n=1 Tax=Mucilaginibacter calamicampi TaxID=1302352 RepID=A0ABW2YWZ1_9SPHI
MDWHKAYNGKLNATTFLLRVKINGKNLCLVGFEDNIYAVGAICPHAGADLSGGWCSDGKLICPFHRYSYDIKTGKGDPGQNDYIDTYPVQVRDDGVYIGMHSFTDKIKMMFK